jgi:hypothetical protein
MFTALTIFNSLDNLPSEKKKNGSYGDKLHKLFNLMVNERELKDFIPVTPVDKIFTYLKSLHPHDSYNSQIIRITNDRQDKIENHISYTDYLAAFQILIYIDSHEKKSLLKKYITNETINYTQDFTLIIDRSFKNCMVKTDADQYYLGSVDPVALLKGLIEIRANITIKTRNRNKCIYRCTDEFFIKAYLFMMFDSTKVSGYYKDNTFYDNYRYPDVVPNAYQFPNNNRIDDDDSSDGMIYFPPPSEFLYGNYEGYAQKLIKELIIKDINGKSIITDTVLKKYKITMFNPTTITNAYVSFDTLLDVRQDLLTFDNECSLYTITKVLYKNYKFEDEGGIKKSCRVEFTKSQDRNQVDISFFHRYS